MKKFWCVIDHPNQIILVRDLVKKAGISKSELNLIYSLHPYHKLTRTNYEEIFNEVISIKRVHHGRNIPRDLYRIVTTYVEIKKLKNKIKHLDVFLLFSGAQYLENVILSLFPNLKIGVFPEVQFKYMNMYKQEYRQFIQMLPLNFVYRLLRLNEIIYGTLPNHKKKTKDGIGVHCYKQNAIELYDFILFDVILDDHRNNFLRTEKSDKIILTNELPNQTGLANEVIFFGNCFLKFNNLEPSDFAKKINASLRYIESNFDKNYRLIYFPHPREEEEIKMIKLNRFELLKNKGNAEDYLRSNKNFIKATFSTASTVLRNALKQKIPSYSFLYCMNFQKTQVDYFLSLFGTVPKEVFIEDFNMPLKKISFLSSSKTNLNLNKILFYESKV